ncbi:protein DETOXIFICATION 12-like isoform X2 [Lolium rigidum]|uniref:protein DETOXIFICATION 12-like isoform X2 n=1 Tax=Lolium rigidum TaxID=89674 RepID=UPI001F5CC22D|nr:protein DETOXIFICATION 12-like isoform X2 [Lolium rigidum]
MYPSCEAPLLLTKEHDEKGRWWREAAEESGRLVAVALPMIFVALLQFMMQLIATAMVGHLGEVELAGAAMANSLTIVTGFSIIAGLACALETICGQAYGAEQYDELSLYTYRSIVVLFLVSVPIGILWLFIPEVLALIGQDPQIANEAGKFALWLIPGLFAFSLSQCFTKFLQCQSLIFPMVLSSLITISVFIPLCWLMVYKVDMGSSGAALSVTICDWVEAIVLCLYIKFSPSCEKTRAPISSEAFRSFGSVMRLGVPSTLMLCISGLLLLNNIPFGLGAAASVRVSNELGAGNPKGARLAVGVALSFIACSAILVSTTLLALRNFIGIAFSKEEEVISYVTRMVPLLSISVITDSFQGVLSGVARGGGWQHLGAYVNLGAFYLVGLPVALFSGFAMQLRGMGFVFGMIAGGATQVILLSVITATTDWEKMAEEAKERVFEERLPKP